MTDKHRRFVFLLTLLREHNVSLAQWHILSALDFMGPCSRSTLVTQAEPMSYGLEEDCFLRREYDAALSQCEREGLVKTVTATDVQRDEERWAGEDQECFSGDEYREGYYEFADAGARVCVAIKSKVDNLRVAHPGFCIRHKGGLVSIFATEEAEAVRARTQVLADVHVYCDDNEEVKSVRGPYRIGPWWTSRHEQIQEGFRVDIEIGPK